MLLHPDRLDPDKVGKLRPLDRPIFVCSLADLFHDEVPYEYVREVFNVMRCCDGSIVAATGKRAPARTFQVLTKRPERALELSRTRQLGFGLEEWQTKAPNIWLGTSIENSRYTYRADVLREIPAKVRFISAEPLLGSLLTAREGRRATGHVKASTGPEREGRAVTTTAARPLDLTGIDWLIVGGESGPKARPMRVEWARELVHAGHQSGTAVFVKQLGAHPLVSSSEYADIYGELDVADTERELPLDDRKGGDWEEWPADLKVREFPR